MEECMMNLISEKVTSWIDFAAQVETRLLKSILKQLLQGDLFKLEDQQVNYGVCYIL
jgi:hypothetical protein